MNKGRHQGGTRGDKSENTAASAAAKPEQESLFESLLRYHEKGKRDKIDPIAFKSAPYDEGKDRKLPAKQKPAFQRSHADAVYQRSLCVTSQLNNMLVNDQDESPPFPTLEPNVPFATPSLFSKLSPRHQMAVDGSVESNRPHGLRGQKGYPRSNLSEPSPPAPCAESTMHDNSTRTDLSHQKMSSFYKSALVSSGAQHSSILTEDVKLALKLAKEMEEEMAKEQARTLELDEKLARELAQKLELEDFQIESQDIDPSLVLMIAREEAERRGTERAPQESSTGLESDEESNCMLAPIAPRTTAPPHVDYVLSQQEAMGELQHVPRPPIGRHPSVTGQREASYRVNFTCYMPHSSDEAQALPNPKAYALLQEENKGFKKANPRVRCPSLKKSVKRFAGANSKRGRPIVETSPP
jgi:hypothetical protein